MGHDSNILTFLPGKLRITILLLWIIVHRFKLHSNLFRTKITYIQSTFFCRVLSYCKTFWCLIWSLYIAILSRWIRTIYGETGEFPIEIIIKKRLIGYCAKLRDPDNKTTPALTFRILEKCILRDICIKMATSVIRSYTRIRTRPTRCRH